MTQWPSPDEPPNSVEQLLAAARAGLRRLSPSDARVAMRNGAHLVDIRSDSRRATDGVIPGAHFVPRNCSSGASTRPARTVTRCSPIPKAAWC